MGDQNRGLLPGTVDLVVLQTLTAGPKHGFAVSRSIRTRSDGVLDLQDAALYKALHRMEKNGWTRAEWGLSEKGKRAKFYHLTAAGAKQLDEEASFWRDYAAAVFKVLEPLGGEG
ncbi:MAG: PadR family transcriptional regulator [Longimicrobiales bacterium]